MSYLFGTQVNTCIYLRICNRSGPIDCVSFSYQNTNIYIIYRRYLRGEMYNNVLGALSVILQNTHTPRNYLISLTTSIRSRSQLAWRMLLYYIKRKRLLIAANIWVILHIWAMIVKNSLLTFVYICKDFWQQCAQVIIRHANGLFAGLHITFSDGLWLHVPNSTGWNRRRILYCKCH